MHVVSVEIFESETSITTHDLSIAEDESFLLANGVIAHNSTICLGRHSLRFRVEPPHEPIGHNIPYLLGTPYHIHCRSDILVVLADGGPIMGGTVETFLRRQSVATQQAMLGTGRWELWQRGRLTVRQLLEATTGRPLRLEELEG